MKILLCVVALLFGYECYGATYNSTVLKDMGTNTPQSTENPGTAPDTFREIKRILESQYHIATFTGNGTATTTDTFLIGSSSTAILISLPSASSVASTATTKLYVVKNIGAGTVTLSPTVDGVGSPTVSQNGSLVIYSDGTRWYEQRVGTSATAILAANALLLNGQNSAYYQDASNLNAGSISLDRIPATLTGKDADTVDSINGASIVQTSRTLTTTLPLTIDGGVSADLSANRPLAMPQASGTSNGYLASGDFTTFNNKQSALNGLYLSKWMVGAVDGTGTVEFIAGAGTSIVAVDHGGSGSITVTAVGTATAGGWVDTGTQTLSTQGQPIVARGTWTVDATYGVSGLLDRDIPNTITLSNITQITTRNISDLQGQLSNSQMPLKNPYGTLTSVSTNGTTSSTGVMAYTGSLPVISEGTEVWSFNYGVSTSTARVDLVYDLVLCSSDISKSIIAALFVNNGTVSVASKIITIPAANAYNGKLNIEYNYLPGTTTSYPYAIRLGAGTDTGGAPPVTLNSYAVNGTSTAYPLFGNGNCTSTARILEYIP